MFIIFSFVLRVGFDQGFFFFFFARIWLFFFILFRLGFNEEHKSDGLTFERFFYQLELWPWLYKESSLDFLFSFSLSLFF